MVNECSICIYNGTKEFTSISNVLPLIETQLWYIQISTIYHPFLRDSIGNTIICNYFGKKEFLHFIWYWLRIMQITVFSHGYKTGYYSCG